jgi:hypothetical protein
MPAARAGQAQPILSDQDEPKAGGRSDRVRTSFLAGSLEGWHPPRVRLVGVSDDPPRLYETWVLGSVEKPGGLLPGVRSSAWPKFPALRPGTERPREDQPARPLRRAAWVVEKAHSYRVALLAVRLRAGGQA